MRLTGICLITDDVLALAAFYSRLLSVPAEGDAHHSELHPEGAGMAIFARRGMEEMAPGSMDGVGRGGAVTLMFQVADVDAEWERVLALGAEVVMPPTTHPWGARSFWVRDPEGNVVDVYEVGR